MNVRWIMMKMMMKMSGRELEDEGNITVRKKIIV